MISMAARECFAAYKSDVLDKAFPLLAKHITHFSDDEYYCSFHYGFLEKLDALLAARVRVNQILEKDGDLLQAARKHKVSVVVVALAERRGVLPLPEGHKFPMAKYAGLRERIADRRRLSDAVGTESEVFILQALTGG